MIIDFSNRDLFNYSYIPLLHCRKRYIFCVGSGGSGKSSFQAQKEIIKSFSAGNRMLGVRKTKESIKDSSYAELCGIIEKWDLGKYFEITRSPLYIKNIVTGSDFVFRGMDDPEKIKSIKGVTRVWIEEATELNKRDFDQIDLRLRGEKELQITCTLNPIDEEHWINQDFYIFGNTADVEILHTTYKDNRFVGAEYEKVMERLKVQNPRMYEIYALGKWGRAVEGLIFSFSELEKIPEEAKLVLRGQDFGFTNDPSALVAIYEWNQSLILDEEMYRIGMTNQDIVNHYKTLGIERTDEIIADSSEPKSIEEIYRAGYNIKGAEKGPDSIMFGIQTMQRFSLYITKRSSNLRKELKNYCWATDKEEKSINKPIDAFNHGIDGARYAITKKYGVKQGVIPGVFIF